jgi:hypothetical protein
MAHGTSGAGSGTSGERARQVFLMLWAAMAFFVIVNNTVHAITQGIDFTRAHQRFHPAEPFIWEYTSAVFTIALIPLVAWLLTVASPGPGRWLRFVAVHVPATGTYSLVHVLGFVGLRRLVYVAFGAHYGGELRLGYEYLKDAVTYFFTLALFWLGGQVAMLWARSDAVRAGRLGPVFDIRDGAKLIRAPVTDIVAVSSAGNYVEFHLADGRRPLMRTTLSAVEAQLRPHGFLRTHRSWVVNPLRVRAMTAEGSGDWLIELDGGAEAPLSRRFPQALNALRAGEAAA